MYQRPSLHLRRLYTALSLAVVLALILSLFPQIVGAPTPIASAASAASIAAALPQPVAQTFYMPQPPATINDYFLNQNNTTTPEGNTPLTSQMHVLQSVVVSQPDTVLVYDQWEDGYEADLNNPVQATTQVWGDGNLANGVAPGHPTDLLDVGDVVTMQGDVVSYILWPGTPRPQRPATYSVFAYDGGDKLGSTRVIGVEAAAWPVPADGVNDADPGYQQADMMSVFPVTGPQSQWGTDFILPVGVNTAGPNFAVFSHTGAFIQAGPGGSTINIDADANGTFEIGPIALADGETYYLNKAGTVTVNQGARITASNPVQVFEVTGQVGATWGCRVFNLFPTTQWGNDYITPVSSGTNTANLGGTHASSVFLRNQNASAITVNYQLSNGTTGTINVPANSTAMFTPPDTGTVRNASRYWTTGSPAPKFYAITASDVSAANSSSSAYEWGFSLWDVTRLTTDGRLPWAPGTVGGPGSINGDRAWFSPLAATTVYVDYDGDPTTGPLTDPNGNKYDVSVAAAALSFNQVIDPDLDQTGVHVYTLDGTKLALVYGEDANDSHSQLNLDIGMMLAPGNINALGDFIWMDLDNDGVQDANEPGLANVKVTLTGPTGTVVTYTDKDGHYLFPDLVPGTFTVTVDPATLPAGMVQTFDPDGTLNNTTSRTLTADQLDTGADFGYRGIGSIGDLVWEDFDASQTRQLGELGVGAARINLTYYGADGILGTADDSVFTATTAADGSYLVTNLPLGKYNAVLDTTSIPPGFALTTPGSFTNFQLTGGSPNYLTADFGVRWAPVKPLYLTDNGGVCTQGLDRVDPIFTGDATTSLSTEIGRNDVARNYNVKDTFTVQSYSNQNSDSTPPQAWTTDWVENDTNAPGVQNPGGGNIKVDTANPGTLKFDVRADATQYVQRSFNMNGASVASLTLVISANALDAADTVQMQVSSNGGSTWTTLETLNSNFTGTKTYANLQNAPYNVALTGNMVLRFKVGQAIANRVIEFDSVTVAWTVPAGAGPTTTSFGMCSPLTSSFTVAAGTVNLCTYVTSAQGNIPTSNPAIPATLKYGATTIASLGNPTTVTAFPPPNVQTAFDDFESNGYSGGTGWGANAWTEINEADGSLAGDERVLSDGTSLIFRVSKGTEGAYREINLAGYDYATLSVDWQRVTDITDPAKGFAIEASNNGGTTWGRLILLTGPQASGTFTADITAYIAANTRIRIIGVGQDNDGYFDNVKITYGLKRREYKLCWSTTLASPVTVPSGQSITLDITNNVGGNTPFEIQYDSLSRPSLISLPAANYINVDSVGVYSAAYPGGVLVTQGDPNVARYIRAVVSDPFGASDITGLQFVIRTPSGAESLVTATQVASTAGTKTYEYNWTSGQLANAGAYTIEAIAAEGTEGLKALSSPPVTYNVLMSLSGHVINDANGNGSLAERTAENGLAGVTVQLFADANQDGVPDGAALQTQVTTGTGVYGGSYTFNNLLPGSYVIVESNLGGYTSTNDTTAPNDDKIPVTLASTSLINQDFLDSTNPQIAPISGRVINDVDGDGDLGERGGEAGIVGVTVQLWTDPNGDGNPADGVLYDTTLTIANGAYTFNAVPPGNFVVVETNPGGYTSTNDTGGPNDNRIPVVRVGATASTGNDFLDATTPNLGSIGDTIYWDKNQSGAPDAGEGIAGVQVYVDYNNNGVRDFNEPFATTNASGVYTIPNMPVGTFNVRVDTTTLPAGFTNTVDPDGTANNQTSVTLTSGQNNTTTDFGYQGTGSIGNETFKDTITQNGVRDAGEGLANVVVYIDANHNGVRDVGELSATTDAAGLYVIGNLPAGSYDVKVDTATLPAGLLNTTDPDATKNSQTTVALAGGQNLTTADWGYKPGGAISGTLWDDGTGNGIYVPGTEPGITGIQVGLFQSDGVTPVLSGGVPYVVTTDANGFYQFTNLPAGVTYMVKVVQATLPSGVTNDVDPDSAFPSGNNQALVSVPAAGGTVANQNFGYILPDPLLKTVSPAGAVNPGATVTYSLNPTYTGSGLFTSLVISDVIPAGSTYVGDSDTPEATVSEPAGGGTGVLTWALGSNVAKTDGSQASSPGGTNAWGTPAQIDTLRPGDANDRLIGTDVVPPDGIATDSSGNIYVVFNQNGVSTFFTKSTDGGATWSTPLNISVGLGDDKNASIAVDSSGNIHVVIDQNIRNVYYRKSTNGGASFSAAVQIDTNRAADSTDRYPDIYAESANNIHVVFNNNNAGTYYTKSTDGGTTWITAVNITTAAGSDKDASIAVDSSGFVHVVIDQNNRNIIYKKSTTAGGTTFSAGIQIDTNRAADSADRFPDIAVDKSTGALHVVFNNNNASSYYTKSTDGGTTWSTALDITSTGAADDIFAQVAVDNCGNTHVAIGQNNRSVYYRTSTNGGTSFTTPTEIDTLTGDNNDRYPAIAVSNAKVHVIFEQLGNDVFYNNATRTACQIATTTSITASPTLVKNGDTVTINITVSAAEAVSNISPTTPTVVNAAGGASCTSMTGTDIGPKSIGAGGGSVTFTYTCLADDGTTLPASVRFQASASGTDGRGNPAAFAAGTSNSVLEPPVLTFQVTANNPATTTSLVNRGVLKDSTVYPNGVPSNQVTTPLNVNLDYGDLPDTYKTLLASDGARHLIYGVRLGATATDAETDGQPNAGATGDNVAGSNDENGVVFSSLYQGQTATLTVTASGAGVLNAWADWNHNGIFDSNERIATNQALVAGSNTLTVNVPPAAVLGNTGFRFRVTDAAGQGGDLPTGLATTGEVEDYMTPVLSPPGSITGQVLKDTDNNNTGDAPLPGVTLTLLNSDGSVYDSDPNTGGVQPLTAVTDASGNYTLANVPPGSYRVSETQPVGYASVSDKDGGNLDIIGDVTLVVVLPATANTGNNFVEEQTGVISGTVMKDTDNNNTGDTPFSGVTVTLYTDPNGDGNPADGVAYGAPVVTNGSGVYSFTGVVPGTYVVVETDLSGYQSVSDGDSTVDSPLTPADAANTNTNDNRLAVNLATGETDSGNDFVDEQFGSITGQVLKDTDNNNTGDAPFASVTLTLLNSDGTVYDSDPLTGGIQPLTAVTDGSGNYSFANLPPGNYRVSETQPAGYASVSDKDGGNLDVIGDVTLIAVAAGAANTGNTFVEEQYGAITGTVTKDTTNDTVGDAPLATVTVRLFADADNNGVADSGTPVATQTTDINGNYTFSNVLPGGYVVVEVDPAGYASVADADSTADLAGSPADFANGSQTDSLLPVNLKAGETDSGNDFVDRGSGSIGDYVWNDRDGDGSQETGEPPLAGVRVFLDTDSDGSYDVGEPFSTTSSTGAYSITGLGPGTYAVRVDTTTLPAGVTQTFDHDGVGTPHVASVSVGPGEAVTDADFGYRGNASIGDLVWNDADSNGSQGGGESGYVGAVVFVDLNSNSVRDANEPFATTDASGNYTISNLTPGTYTVTVDTSTLPAGATPTYDLFAPANGIAPGVTLTAGQARTDVDFGFQSNGAIGDYVWNDMDGDGVQDTSEPPLVGVRVFVDSNGNTTYDAGEPNALTNAAGLYFINNLSQNNTPGYTVRVDTNTLPAGLTPTYDLNGIGTPNVVTGVTLNANEIRTDVDFGYQGNSSIGDYIWLDRDADGVQDPGEPPLAGVDVFLDLNGNGVWDTTEPKQTTSAAGAYTFSGLAAGTYTVRVDPATLPAVVNPTFDANGTGTPHAATVILPAATANTNVDFGYVGTSTPLGDYVWIDVDGDGVQEAGEPPLANVTVFIDSNNNGVRDTAEPFATTDTAGLYGIVGLPGGTYKVMVETSTLPAGVAPSYDLDGTGTANFVAAVSLAVNTPRTDVDFGYKGTGSITGTVKADTDNNNTGDTGLSGITVTLYTDPNGDGDPADGVVYGSPMTTDGNGAYTFVGVVPGSYVVVQTNLTGYQSVADGDATADSPLTPADVANASQTDNRLPVTLAAGETDSGNDFVDEQLGAISGTVAQDTNNDSTGETTLQGVTVRLFTDPNGDGDPADGTQVGSSQTTDINGAYAFTGVQPGSYVVVETDPLGYQSAADGDSTADSPLNPADAANASQTDNRLPVNLAAGETDSGNDFVERILALSGTVYRDADGLTDLTVDGTGTNVGGTLHANLLLGGNVVATIPVNGDGTYSFSNLLSGAYTVQLSTTPGVVGNPPPATSLPLGWINTGENLGAGAGSDGAPDGLLAVTVALVSVNNANFGIERLPDTNPAPAPTQDNPGGATTVQVPTLTGNDPEDGALNAGESFKIVSLPLDGTLYYNGTPVTAGQIITNYDPALLRVDPNDGTVTVTFTYAAVDAAGQVDPTPGIVTMPFIDPPVLAMDKDTETPLVVAGGQATYFIVVANNGGSPATGVTVADTLPAGFTFASVSATTLSGGATGPTPATNGGTAAAPSFGSYTIPASGSVSITFVVNVGAGVTPGTYDNTASVSASNHATIDDDGLAALDPGTLPSDTPETDEDVTVQGPPALAMDKDTTTPTVVAGGQATYTIVVANNGGSAANGVIVTDTLPAGFTYASSSVVETSATRGPTSDPTVGQNALSWGTWRINPGGQIQITVVVNVGLATTPGTYDNTASASASNHATIDDDGLAALDPGALPSDTLETDEDVTIPAPVIGIAKRVLSNARNGDGTYTVTYRLDVQNTGGVLISSLQITDTLAATFAAPTTFTVTNVTSPDFGVNFPGFDGDSDLNLLTGGDSLAPSAQGIVDIEVIINPGNNPGPYWNVAVASGMGQGGIPVSDDSQNGVDTDPDTPGNTPGDNPNPGDNNDPTPVLFDPSGFIYNEKTGKILTGGSISVSGPGAVIITQNGATGQYEFFTDGTPGIYTITVTPPPGYAPSTACPSSDPPAYNPPSQTTPVILGSDENGSSGFLVSAACGANPYYFTFDLAPGDPFILRNNFPMRGIMSLGNLVFHDVDNNGVFASPGDSGLANVDVQLFASGSTPITANALMTVTTDATGYYTFTGLAPGDYFVYIPNSEFAAGTGTLAGYLSSTGNGVSAPDPDDNVNNDDNGDPGSIISKVITLVGNAEPINDGDADPNSNLTLDLGVYQAAIIGDFVFFDNNGNGVQDGGETTGINGVPVTLTNVGTNQVYNTGTVNGAYQFSNLPPGTYRVEVPSSVPGLVRTTTSPHIVTVVSGQNYTQADFGYISPTGVALSSFSATASGTGVMVRWATFVEEDIDGFVVWRSFQATGDYTAISDLIPSQDPIGASYEWLDASAESGQSYWYKLQSQPDGQFFGPILTAPEGGFKTLFTPLILRRP